MGFVVIVVLAVLAGIVIFAVGIWFTQFLWNYAMPEIFGLKKINFWQTFALLTLTGIFGSAFLGSHDVWQTSNAASHSGQHDNEDSKADVNSDNPDPSKKP